MKSTIVRRFCFVDIQNFPQSEYSGVPIPTVHTADPDGHCGHLCSQTSVLHETKPLFKVWGLFSTKYYNLDRIVPRFALGTIYM